MRIRLPGRPWPAEAGRAHDARRVPEAAAVTWTRAELREWIQQAGVALPRPPSQPTGGLTSRAFTAGRQRGRTVTTLDSSIAQDLTPVEAAHLLERLEEGHQAAWLSTHQVPWHSAEYQARFQNAAEVDDVFRELMWETVENGLRRPGEPVEEFAERAESEARLADARKASAEPPVDMISKDAGITRERLAERQDERAGRLRNDASTPEGRAYARAFSDTAATYVRQLRARDPLPEPDRVPGAPHPDPFLASRGWHVNKHGIYTRRAEPESQASPERDLEAGS
jgi:hypothetical protein